MYVTPAGGDKSKQTQAKTWLTKSFTGALIKDSFTFNHPVSWRFLWKRFSW